jgi:hypothetical protein
MGVCRNRGLETSEIRRDTTMETVRLAGNHRTGKLGRSNRPINSSTLFVRRKYSLDGTEPEGGQNVGGLRSAH